MKHDIKLIKLLSLHVVNFRVHGCAAEFQVGAGGKNIKKMKRGNF